MQTRPRKRLRSMSPLNFYDQWRAQSGNRLLLREGEAATPPEKLLQAVWQQQRLLRDQLKTLDGRSLRVIHPGFKNREAGPDFHGAVIQLGDEPPRSGDVEVDLVSAGWRAHGHDCNPNFKNVILHVVWETERAAAGLPATLALRAVLDAPLRELDLWFGGAAAAELPENFRGRCSAPLRELPPEKLSGLLQQAAQVRLRGKAAWFSARAKQAGWEQALWEGLFRALGYKQNVWPMQRLAELRPQLFAGKNPDALTLQSRLLGVAGLLPTEPTRAQASADDYLRRVWDSWWREREEFGDVVLPRAAWKFNGLRPANHPQRRLALAAHWLAAGDLPVKLERWCLAEISERLLAESLLEILQVERDDFWSWHWTMRSAQLAKPQPLLGATRVTDLAVNVVLPWLWSRASEGGNAKLRQEIERRYFAWPAAEDNAVLKLARQRLLGLAGRKLFNTSVAQQGLLQIGRDFCDGSNAACEACRFPDLVRAWASSSESALPAL